ncbi:MAG: DUF389 domain-containing protein [Moorea sp. SIO2B7]|nr:DUF389 domain-containing protein [Moorena sp. SIO2B7]
MYRWVKLIGLKFRRKYSPKEVAEHKYKHLHKTLSIDASWNLNYIVLTISACLIATFGLISNSTAVIIGAMLVAPLMLPLRALAFGALEGDFQLFRKALLSIIGATILSLFLSWLTGTLVRIPEFGSEVISRTHPNLVDLGIAVTAGAISGFAKVRKGVSDALAGTAISVALMPPLCVVGLSLSQGELSFGKGAFLLYVTNLLGITLACMFVFIVAGYAKISHALGWTLGLTAILVIPLGASFLQLVKKDQLEAEIIKKLVNETITVGEGVDNTSIKVDWTKNPPIVYIILQTDKDITPRQAKLVEEFITKKMEQSFNLVFYVNKVSTITAQDEEIQKDKDDKINQDNIEDKVNQDDLEDKINQDNKKNTDSPKLQPMPTPDIPTLRKKPKT